MSEKVETREEECPNCEALITVKGCGCVKVQCPNCKTIMPSCAG